MLNIAQSNYQIALTEYNYLFELMKEQQSQLIELQKHLASIEDEYDTKKADYETKQQEYLDASSSWWSQEPGLTQTLTDASSAYDEALQAYNTNFTFNISNTISKVISITLYSYQIPTTWYSFSLENGNTFFIYNGIIINIPDGNYTKQTIVDEINLIASSKPSTSGLEMTYNEKTNK